MKKIVTVFARNRYVSGATGLSQSYQMPANLMSSVGNSVVMRWEVTVYARSANADLKLNMYEGTKQDPRPSTNDFSGKTITGSPFNYGGIGIDLTDISFSYSGLIDVVLAVKHASSGTSQEWVDAEVRVTLTYN